MEINTLAMGQRIRQARKQSGMTCEALAAAIGITIESLWHIENGARKTSLTTLVKIAAALNVSMDYLVGLSGSPVDSIVHSVARNHELTEAQTELLLALCNSMVPTIKEMK